MFCALTNDQIVKFFQYTYKQLRSSEGQSISFEQLVQDTYDMIFNAQNNEALALTYASLIPQNMLTASSYSKEVRAILRTNNIDLNNLSDLIDQWEDLTLVRAFLDAQAGPDKLAVMIAGKTSTQTFFTPEEDYEEIENESQEVDKYQFKKANALSTTGQEAQDDKSSDVDLSDTNKLVYHNTKRKLKLLQAEQKVPYAQLELTGPDRKVNGVRLTAVHDSKIPTDNLYDGKYKDGGIYGVITDTDGNYLYFNQAGELATADTGRLAITFIHKPVLNTDGKFDLLGVDGKPILRSIEELMKLVKAVEVDGENETDPEKIAVMLEESRQTDFKSLNDLREAIGANPELVIGLPINYISDGVIKSNYSKPSPLSKLSIDRIEFSLATKSTADKSRKAGGVYFDIPGVKSNILVVRPLIPENIATTIVETAMAPYNDANRAQKAVDYIEAMVLTNRNGLSFKVNPKTGNIIITLKTKAGDRVFVDTIHDKNNLKKVLKERKLNINKNLLNNNFTYREFSDGKFQDPVEMDYNEFIKQNFMTYYTPNSEGKLQPLNAYIEFDTPSIEDIAKITTKESIEEVVETTPKVVDTIPSRKSEDIAKEIAATLFKVKSIDNVATPEQIQAAEEWWNKSPLSKSIAFNNMMDVVNSNAFGTFTTNGITLYAGANFTDLYHEAWHGFSQMFLTLEQKKNLYGELQKIDRYKDKTFKDIEEVLAEDFRKYVLSDGKQILEERPVRNGIFRRILNFLRSLFGDKAYAELQTSDAALNNVRELYEQLYKGEVNQYTPSVTNMQFGILNKGIEGKTRILTNAESQLISDSMDSIISEFFRNQKKSVMNLFELKGVLTTLQDKYIKVVFEEKLKAEGTTDMQKELLQFAVENFDAVKAYHSGDKKNNIPGRSKFLSSVAYKSESKSHFDNDGNLVEESKEEGDDTTDKKISEQSRDSMGSKSGNEESMKDMASNDTLYLISGLTELNKDGTPVLNALGYPQLADFFTTWNKLIKTLEGTLTPQEMIDKLLKASKENPEFIELVQKLGPVDEHTDFLQYNMMTRFWQSMNKTRIPIFEGFIEKQNDGSFLFKFGESAGNTSRVKANFIDKFQTSYEAPYSFVEQENGQNALNVPKILEDFGVKIYSDKYEDRMDTNNKPKPQKDIPYTWAVQPSKRMDFVRAIGFNMSDKKQITQTIREMEDLDYVLQDLSIMQEKGAVIINPIDDLLKPFYGTGKKKLTSGQGTVVNALLSMESKFSDNYSNYSVVNAAGNMEYEHSLNNFLSIVTNHLNNVTTYPDYQSLIRNPALSRYDINKNPLIRNSRWLNSLFILDTVDAQGRPDTLNSRYGQRRINKDGSFVTIDLANYNGIRLIDESVAANEGIKTSSLDRTSKLLQDMNSMLGYGMMELPRHASKSSAFALRISSLNNGAVSSNIEGHLYFPIRDFLTPSKQIDSNVFKYVKGALVDELTRIKWSRAGVGKNIPGYNKRSLNFSLFDDMMIPESVKVSLINGVDNIADEDITVFVSTFDKELSKAFKDYFNAIEEENFKEFSRSPHLSNELDAKVIEYAEDRGTKMSKEDRDRAINRAFTYNAWVNNVEAIKFIYGDLAFYKTEKEEFHKRNTAYSATGTVPRTDDASNKFINAQGRRVARMLGLEEKPFDGTFDSAILRDANFKESSIKGLEELFTKHFTQLAATLPEEVRAEYIKQNLEESLAPYEKMTEGDAQGWITLDAYRIFKMAQGIWDSSLENLYLKMSDGATLTNREMAQMFVPIKAQYAGPIKTDKLAVPGFHKFSLMPLIPSMIKGTSFEHINQNFIKNGIDYALFESGSKIATVTADGSYDKLYEDYDTRSDYNGGYAKNTVFLDYLKEQVAIEPHFKEHVIFSTQLRKLIENGLYKEGVAVSDRALQLDRDFVGHINRLTELRRKQLLKETGINQDADGNYIVNDYKPLVTLLHKELQSRDLPDNVIDFIDLIPFTRQDGSIVHKLKQPLDLSTSSQKIETMLQSIINNRLVRQKVFGEPLIQLAGSGFESNESKNKYTNPTDQDLAKYGTNDLPFYVPGGRTLTDGTKVTSAMKIKRALKPSDRPLLSLLHNDGEQVATLDRLNDMLKDEQWLDKDDNRKMITMVGVRIPVQGLNSMEFMEVHHFLPTEAGNIIVPPTAIVAKSGSDFDIDKLTIFFPNIKMISGKVTLYNSKEHSLSNEEIDTIYDPKIAAMDQALEDSWQFYQKQFEAFKKKALLSDEDRGLLNEHNDKFADKISLIKDRIEGFEALLRGMKSGKTTGTYEEYQDIENQVSELRYDMSMERIYHREYVRGLMDTYKYELREERDAKKKELKDERRDLAKTKEALKNSDIKATENGIIDTIRAILEMESNVIDLLTPNGTGIVKPVADALEDLVSDYNAAYSKTTGKIEKSGSKKIVSPTRAVETRYNLYKHESNSIGKATLGLGAIDNTFNALLNKAGAYLNTEYNREQENDKKTGQPRKPIVVPVTIRLIHNKKTVGDKEHISLSHLYDASGKNKISEVISQLMNGWVDIEKDAWIFNVNGGLEAAPTILLLNQAGVPFDQIAKFVTQPAILEYVRALQGSKNLFEKTADPDRFKFYKSTVKKEIFGRLLGLTIDRAEKIDKLVNLDNHNDLFTEAELNKKQDEGAKQAAYLLHFIQLSDLAQTMGDIKQSLNFDTTRSKNLFEAQQKINKYSAVQNVNLFPADVLNSLRNDSVISSFAVQNLSLNLWTKLLPLRNNPRVNSFIVEKLKDLPMETRTALSDKFARTFKNDMLEHILQNFALPESWSKDNGALWKAMFIGDNPLGNELYQIKEKYPQLAEKYSLVKNLVRNKTKQKKDDKKKVINNIKLIDGVLDTPKINKYYEEFESLINPDVKKSEDPKENQEITSFFRKLALFGFLQSGLNKSNLSFTEVIPQRTYTGLMEAPIKEITKNIGEEFLNDFYAKFRANNPTLFSRKSNLEPHRLKDFTQVIKEAVIQEEDVIPEFDGKDYTNHSGGAIGGDETWDQIGRAYGFNNHKHWREPGKTKVDSKLLDQQGIKATPASRHDYEEGIAKATKAAADMGRKISQAGAHYQYRNWLQVKYADAIYAVSTILEKGEKDKKGYTAKNTQVEGGTGYAVQMAINQGKPVYVFDQREDQWFKAAYTVDMFGEKTCNGFVPTDIPVLTKNFAGIGSRELEDNGRQAITNVYKKTIIQATTPVKVSESDENSVNSSIPDDLTDLQNELGDIEGECPF